MNYYKANLHCHSTLSDGSCTPEELKEIYKKHGYSIIAYTDHDVFISHKSIELGFNNYLVTTLPVLHLPHSSRPWKQLKYTNPIKYYWRKLIDKRDKI